MKRTNRLVFLSKFQQVNPEVIFRQLMLGRWQIAMVISGGGSGSVPSCLRRSGASKNFVEIAIPYSRASMENYLGNKTAGPSASIETARQLASRALDRASQFSDLQDAIPVGLSLTAALPTQPPRDQVNQIHVSLQSDGVIKDWSQFFGPQITSRSEAETVADDMLMHAIEFLCSGLHPPNKFENAPVSDWFPLTRTLSTWKAGRHWSTTTGHGSVAARLLGLTLIASGTSATEK